MTMSAREKVIVAFTAALAILCLGYVWGVEPAMKYQRSSEAKIEALGRKYEKMKSVARGEKALVAKRKKLIEKTAVPGGSENASGYMLERLAEVTNRPGLSVNGVAPLPDEKFAYFDSIHARLDIECNLADYVALVMDLENEAVPIQVVKTEIGPKEKESDMLKGYIEVSMKVLKGSAL